MNRPKYLTNLQMAAEIVSEEMVFNKCFEVADIMAYCECLTTDAKENVICRIISKSIFIFEGRRLIYNFDIGRNIFVPLLNNNNQIYELF